MAELKPLQEAAAEHGVTRFLIHRLIRKGQLRAFSRIGDKRTFIDSGELAKLLELKPGGAMAPKDAVGAGAG